MVKEDDAALDMLNQRITKDKYKQIPEPPPDQSSVAETNINHLLHIFNNKYHATVALSLGKISVIMTFKICLTTYRC